MVILEKRQKKDTHNHTNSSPRVAALSTIPKDEGGGRRTLFLLCFPPSILCLVMLSIILYCLIAWVVRIGGCGKREKKG